MKTKAFKKKQTKKKSEFGWGGARKGSGRPSDPNRLVTKSFTLPREVYDALVERADDTGVSVSGVAREVLGEFCVKKRLVTRQQARL